MELVIGERMSRPLAPRGPRPRRERLGEGGGRGPTGAGPTPHGGGGACGRPARSVRTSESARHRDQRDPRSGRSRAGPSPACEPAASAPSASRAGRRLAASEEGAKSGVPRDTRAVPSRLALTPVCVLVSVRMRVCVCVCVPRARPPALLSVRCVWRAPLSVRAPGLAARRGSPGALLGRRERGRQLCAPCRLRRDSGPQASPPPHIFPPESCRCAEGEPGGEQTRETRGGRGTERGDGDRWRQAVPRSPLLSAVAVSHPQMFWGPVFLGIRDGKKSHFCTVPQFLLRKRER